MLATWCQYWLYFEIIVEYFWYVIVMKHKILSHLFSATVYPVESRAGYFVSGCYVIDITRHKRGFYKEAGKVYRTDNGMSMCFSI